MSGVFGDFERWQRARKQHRCQGGCRKDIQPGDVYLVAVVLPGSGERPIGGGDYETEDWDFGWIKMCQPCYDDSVR